MDHARTARVALILGLSCWAVYWWQLGYPSFWDPDEAHYAQATREMLASGNWLVPLYDGKPFFDKPVLFQILQLVAFSALGPTEFAARTVSAGSAMALCVFVAYVGRRLFGGHVGIVAAVMLTILPATFALSSYAILDATFTLFLFGGCGLAVTAALTSRPTLQYPGYLLMAAAVLTKGPLAIALAGLSFLLGLVIAPAARPALLGLQWMRGLGIVLALSAPWFVYMWLSFGSAFIDGYALKENLLLYTRPPYANQPSYFFYMRVTAVGLLPWTPLLIGRLYDALRGRPLDSAERLLWAWVAAVVGFFTFSSFKLDHYIYPAAPALTLLSARAWADATSAAGERRGVVWAAFGVGVVLALAGIALFIAIRRAPLEVSVWAYLIPLALSGAGLWLSTQMVRDRFHGAPSITPPIAAFVAAYAVLVQVGLPAFEAAKPVRGLARLVAQSAGPADHVGMYRLNRWSTSWRFYAEHPTTAMETPDQMRVFLARPGRHYVGMRRQDFTVLSEEQGLPLRILREDHGLFTTTGRTLRRGTGSRTSFVVATDAPDRRMTTAR